MARIISVFGLVPGAGATFISTNIAAFFAKEEANTLLIGLGARGVLGALFMAEAAREQVYPAIETWREFENPGESLLRTPYGLAVLPARASAGDRQEIPEITVRESLEYFSPIFDVVVIDVGGDLYLPHFKPSVAAADVNFIVAEPTQRCIQALPDHHKTELAKNQNLQLIVNRVSTGSSGAYYHPRDIARWLDINDYIAVPEEPARVNDATKKRLPLVLYGRGKACASLINAAESAFDFEPENKTIAKVDMNEPSAETVKNIIKKITTVSVPKLTKKRRQTLGNAIPLIWSPIHEQQEDDSGKIAADSLHSLKQPSPETEINSDVNNKTTINEKQLHVNNKTAGNSGSLKPTVLLGFGNDDINNWFINAFGEDVKILSIISSVDEFKSNVIEKRPCIVVLSRLGSVGGVPGSDDMAEWASGRVPYIIYIAGEIDEEGKEISDRLKASGIEYVISCPVGGFISVDELVFNIYNIIRKIRNGEGKDSPVVEDAAVKDEDTVTKVIKNKLTQIIKQTAEKAVHERKKKEHVKVKNRNEGIALEEKPSTEIFNENIKNPTAIIPGGVFVVVSPWRPGLAGRLAAHTVKMFSEIEGSEVARILGRQNKAQVRYGWISPTKN